MICSSISTNWQGSTSQTTNDSSCRLNCDGPLTQYPQIS